MLRPTRGIYEKIHVHKTTTTTHKGVVEYSKKANINRDPFRFLWEIFLARENVVQTDQYETTTTTLVLVRRAPGSKNIQDKQNTFSLFFFSPPVEDKIFFAPLQDTI